eukprot:g5566.t1
MIFRAYSMFIFVTFLINNVFVMAQVTTVQAKVNSLVVGKSPTELYATFRVGSNGATNKIYVIAQTPSGTPFLSNLRPGNLAAAGCNTRVEVRNTDVQLLSHGTYWEEAARCVPLVTDQECLQIQTRALCYNHCYWNTEGACRQKAQTCQQVQNPSRVNCLVDDHCRLEPAKSGLELTLAGNLSNLAIVDIFLSASEDCVFAPNEIAFSYERIFLNNSVYGKCKGLNSQQQSSATRARKVTAPRPTECQDLCDRFHCIAFSFYKQNLGNNAGNSNCHLYGPSLDVQTLNGKSGFTGWTTTNTGPNNSFNNVNKLDPGSSFVGCYKKDVQRGLRFFFKTQAEPQQAAAPVLNVVGSSDVTESTSGTQGECHSSCADCTLKEIATKCTTCKISNGRIGPLTPAPTESNFEGTCSSSWIRLNNLKQYGVLTAIAISVKMPSNLSNGAYFGFYETFPRMTGTATHSLLEQNGSCTAAKHSLVVRDMPRIKASLQSCTRLASSNLDNVQPLDREIRC